MTTVSHGGWALHQLTAFVATVSSVTDARAAIAAAVRAAGEALDTEVVAVLGHDGVAGCIGFPEGRVPVSVLQQIVDGHTEVVTLPDLGAGRAAWVDLDDRTARALLVVRLGDQPLTQEERSVLRALGRALMLQLRLLDTLDGERALREESERRAREIASLADELRKGQDLLSRLLDIQRAISRRAPLQDVLDTISASAARLLTTDLVLLRLLDPHDKEQLVPSSTLGVPADLDPFPRQPLATAGIGGQAVVEQRLVATNDYPHMAYALEDYAAAGVHCAMAAPVFINAIIAGSLTVASRDPECFYDPDDQQMLRAFAEHASLALTDAQTLEQIDQAFRDPLTGLPNRALFLDRLGHALDRYRRSQFDLCVMFLDLDRFKFINDSLGHAAGDQLLTVVAERVESCMRRADTAARLGGDELAILLEGVPVAQARELADRVLGSLREPVELEHRTVYVTASIGIADTADITPDASALLRGADVAMYRAKHAGGDQYRVFERDFHEAELQRMEFEGDLRRALGNDELRLVYQPIVELATSKVVGVEALLRWHHPDRGVVSPERFVPVAEETGLIIEIGRWALRTACAQGARWRLLIAERPFYLSVNVSARQLQEGGFVDEVTAVLEDAGLPPQKLVLEITETGLMHDPSKAAMTLQALKRLGVQVAVDDFGTGYSSLSYLRQFPVDVMKIDRSFVSGLTDRQDPLTDTMVGLARTMRLDTVAEGIETQEQLEWLQEIGCTLGQGYYFSHPLPFEDLTDIIRRGVCHPDREQRPLDVDHSLQPSGEG